MNRPQMISSISVLAVLASASVSLPALAADDTVTIVARFYATPGKEAEAEARLLKSLDFVRKNEPNITYKFYHSKKDPTLFLSYEIYPSQAELENHVKNVLPASRAALGAFPDGMFSRPMEFDMWQEMSN